VDYGIKGYNQVNNNRQDFERSDNIRDYQQFNEDKIMKGIVGFFKARDQEEEEKKAEFEKQKEKAKAEKKARQDAIEKAGTHVVVQNSEDSYAENYMQRVINRDVEEKRRQEVFDEANDYTAHYYKGLEDGKPFNREEFDQGLNTLLETKATELGLEGEKKQRFVNGMMKSQAFAHLRMGVDETNNRFEVQYRIEDILATDNTLPQEKGYMIYKTIDSAEKRKMIGPDEANALRWKYGQKLFTTDLEETVNNVGAGNGSTELYSRILKNIEDQDFLATYGFNEKQKEKLESYVKEYFKEEHVAITKEKLDAARKFRFENSGDFFFKDNNEKLTDKPLTSQVNYVLNNMILHNEENPTTLSHQNGNTDSQNIRYMVSNGITLSQNLTKEDKDEIDLAYNDIVRTEIINSKFVNAKKNIGSAETGTVGMLMDNTAVELGGLTSGNMKSVNENELLQGIVINNLHKKNVESNAAEVDALFYNNKTIGKYYGINSDSFLRLQYAKDTCKTTGNCAAIKQTDILANAYLVQAIAEAGGAEQLDQTWKNDEGGRMGANRGAASVANKNAKEVPNHDFKDILDNYMKIKQNGYFGNGNRIVSADLKTKGTQHPKLTNSPSGRELSQKARNKILNDLQNQKMRVLIDGQEMEVTNVLDTRIIYTTDGKGVMLQIGNNVLVNKEGKFLFDFNGNPIESNNSRIVSDKEREAAAAEGLKITKDSKQLPE